MPKGCAGERMGANGCECKMSKKRNVVLYLDTELVKKSRGLGFNFSKTFENHSKQLIAYTQVKLGS
jgi:hypothetical protein